MYVSLSENLEIRDESSRIRMRRKDIQAKNWELSCWLIAAWLCFPEIEEAMT